MIKKIYINEKNIFKNIFKLSKKNLFKMSNDKEKITKNYLKSLDIIKKKLNNCSY